MTLQFVGAVLPLWTLFTVGASMSKLEVSHAAVRSPSNCSDISSALWDDLREVIRKGNLPQLMELLGEGLCMDCQSLRHRMLSPPLHLAATSDSSMVLRYLILNGGGENCKDFLGNTPLHVAAGSCNVLAVKELLRHGAHVNSRNDDGKTPLHVAAATNSCDSYNREKLPGVLEELVSAGAFIETVDNMGKTPLSDTIYINDVFQTLVDLGADLNFTNSKGTNVLHEVAYEAYPYLLEFLIDREVCIDCQEAGGWSPLHNAVMADSMTAVRYLVEAGAAVNIKDDLGFTPLIYAKGEGHTLIAGYLESKGGIE